MKRMVLFSSAILMGSMFVVSQGQAPDSKVGGSGDAVQLIPGRMDAGCPISMRAQQKGMGDLLLADKGREGKVDGPVQRIHLTLGKETESSEEIARVRVTVHGTGAENRMYRVPAGEMDPRSDGNGSFRPGLRVDRMRTFDLPFRPNAEGEIAAELVLRGFTSVTWINLDSVTFADGSVWRSGAGLRCRTSPDLLMLIAGH